MATLHINHLDDEVVRCLERRAASAEARLEALSSMAIIWEADEMVSADALRIAMAHNHPAYDCVYLALARRIDATLVTAAERFMNLAVPAEYRDAIMLLSDFA